MNILNKFCDKIYVISSFETKDRMNSLIPFLNDEKIEFELLISPRYKHFKIPDYSKTSLSEKLQSLHSTFESIFLKSKLMGYKTIAIVEDDIFFTDDYNTKLNNFFNNLPNDWHIINLGYHKNTPINEKISNSSFFYKLKPNEEITGGHIVIYKDLVFENMIDLLNTKTIPVDWIVSRCLNGPFNLYTCSEKIFYASSYRDYESDKNEFYKKYKSALC